MKFARFNGNVISIIFIITIITVVIIVVIVIVIVIIIITVLIFHLVITSSLDNLHVSQLN